MGPIAEVDLSLVQFAELIDCYLLHFQHGRLVHGSKEQPSLIRTLT